MEQEEKANGLGLIVFILIIGGLLGAGIYFTQPIRDESAKNREIRYEQIMRGEAENRVCLKNNQETIGKFTIDCISALKVEENAYVVDSCDEKARNLYCPKDY